MAPLLTIWCRTCRMGFALLRAAPDRCPNEACRVGDAWWTAESPTPRSAYNLTADDMRLLRSFRIDPVQ